MKTRGLVDVFLRFINILPWVQLKAGAYGICGGQMGTGRSYEDIGFPLSLSLQKKLYIHSLVYHRLYIICEVDGLIKDH